MKLKSIDFNANVVSLPLNTFSLDLIFGSTIAQRLTVCHVCKSRSKYILPNLYKGKNVILVLMLTQGPESISLSPEIFKPALGQNLFSGIGRT